MGINSPLPASLESECQKCAKILAAFIDPKEPLGADQVIPPSIRANAKGLAILTVVKAGFLGSARFGSGLVVTRLPDRTWSAPSAIATAGAGVGGQIGIELTDFVFILNDASAVRTFADAGSLTLGGNVSVAAGPVGRNIEAAGAASAHSIAGIFSYSKTRGLFAGVSLEGSAIVERKDANRRFYGRPISAKALLSGEMPPPPAATALMHVLGSLNDAREHPTSVGHRNHHGAGHRASMIYESMARKISEKRSSYHGGGGGDGGRHSRVDGNDQPEHEPGTVEDVDAWLASHGEAGKKPQSAKPPKPSKPASMAATHKDEEVVALWDFDVVQPGDLAFKKGDVIKVLKKTESKNDWWTGMIGTRHGIFPSNYVKART